MKATEFTALIQNGHLPEGVKNAISGLLKSLDGKKVVITIREAVRPRSLKQNALLWSSVYPPITKLFRDAGNNVDDEDIHEFCKTVVAKLKTVIVLPDGEVKTMPGSTRKLTTQEMSDYIEKINAYFAPYFNPERDSFA